MVPPRILLDHRGLTVGYGRQPVLTQVDLAVQAGEVVGLVGPNGAGKSTLLRAVTGEASTLAGGIEVCGHLLSELSERERAALVGVVPQSVTATFSFSASEFVEMGRHPHLPRFGRPGPEDRAAVVRALRLTGTQHLADRPVDALSGGDLQRLVLAQALATEPRVLLLDEPTSHLDLNHRLQVLDLVRDLADTGLAVLAVFHDLDLAARYSDRIAVVSSGGVANADQPERVLTAEMLRSVFGVRAVVQHDPVSGAVSVTPVLRDGAVSSIRRGEVLVIGGAGSAASLMRQLVLAGYGVSAAALNEGDPDALVARALGIAYASVPAFAPMDSDAAIDVARAAEKVDAVVVCDVPFGHGNIDNLLIAVRAEKPLVLVGDIEGRDFAGGAARSYWIEAVRDRGAVVVADTEAVIPALEGLRSGIG